jgi:hypothetical protein
LKDIYQTDNPNPEDAGYYPLDEDAMLGNLKEERLLDNDRWQSMLFRDEQSGLFSGTYEMFAPLIRDGVMGLKRVDSGGVQSAITTQEMKPFGVKVSITEKMSSESESLPGPPYEKLTQPSEYELLPRQLRRDFGNQLIGNAYTVVRELGEYYITEVCVREGPIRIRVKYGFSKQGIYVTVFAIDLQLLNMCCSCFDND